MDNISKDHVKAAIDRFLIEQLNKKLEPELKALEKAEQATDLKKIEEINSRISLLKEKYSLDLWMEDAACRMANQLKFGTHISKGVHPDSKGDNVNFLGGPALPDGIVGSQVLSKLELDANGNAAALPLAAFFNTSVNDAGVKLRNLIQNQHPAIEGLLASTPEKSKEFAALLKASLDNKITVPVSFERNKQVLWPMGADSIIENKYICLVPLFPSALTHALYNSVNEARYSEANLQARDNRKKNNVEHQPYVSIKDLAIVRLGGTKPRNVSQLASRQGGRNFLLPSLPPKLNQHSTYSISKNQKNFFNKRLAYLCRFGLYELYEVVQSEKSIVEVRDKRKQALDAILVQILIFAEKIQHESLPGWSRDCELELMQKYWLDPKRVELEDEQEFAKNKAATDWVSKIEHGFSLWLNALLKQKFSKQQHDFGDPEHNEWLREMREAIKASQRARRGIF